MTILTSVMRALDSLQDEFRQAPTLFFTEHDIASRAYQLIQEGLNNYQVTSPSGSKYFLVHHEYPTPFRCDMKNSQFAVKDDDTRTPKGGKYQRGHYDLVVFAPEFLQLCSFQLAKGQDYSLVTREMMAVLDQINSEPIICGVEFMYNRNPFCSMTDAENWCKFVKQDYDKLEASKTWHGRPFMRLTIMLAFDIGGHGYEHHIGAELSKKPGLVYCHP